jgi:hypothetical protein
MQDIKTKVIAVGIFFAFFIGIALFSVYKARPEYQQNKVETEKYYLRYAILLKGVIADKQPVITGVLTSNYFTYIVKISECNVNEHDVREYLENYYLLVKNDTARFVSHSSFGGEIGDSIIVDYVKGKQYVWRSQIEHYKHDLPIFNLHYNSLRKESLGW